MPYSPPWAAAALRNREPILAYLHAVLPSSFACPTPAPSHALECASGTGAHVALNAAAFPGLLWHPTDLDPDAIAPDALMAENVLPPERLDVSAPVVDWPASVTAANGMYALVLCVNMVHIAPRAATTGLLRGVGELLADDGVLVLYGPFFEENVATAPGNIAFDQSLRSTDSRWGVRRLDDVVAEAKEVGLRLWKRQEMPANNLCVAFRRKEGSP